MSRGLPTKYDEALSGILNTEGQIVPFLNIIFGFLYRKTDFFHPLTVEGKSGFPTGTAEELIRKTFKKFLKMSERERSPPLPVPPVIKVADIRTEEGLTSPETGEIRPIPTIVSYHADDPGNGAVHDKFAWNQTIHDLDVKVYVPKSISKSKQLTVELTGTTVKVATRDDNETVLEGSFNKPINSAESMWILVPGEYIQMTLEKEMEAWWDCLLVGEGKIDLNNINAEISFMDMKQEEQQLIRKMIIDQQMTTVGKLTPSQVQVAETLRTG